MSVCSPLDRQFLRITSRAVGGRHVFSFYRLPGNGVLMTARRVNVTMLSITGGSFATDARVSYSFVDRNFDSFGLANGDIQDLLLSGCGGM